MRCILVNGGVGVRRLPDPAAGWLAGYLNSRTWKREKESIFRFQLSPLSFSQENSYFWLWDSCDWDLGTSRCSISSSPTRIGTWGSLALGDRRHGLVGDCARPGARKRPGLSSRSMGSCMSLENQRKHFMQKLVFWFVFSSVIAGSSPVVDGRICRDLTELVCLLRNFACSAFWLLVLMTFGKRD